MSILTDPNDSLLNADIALRRSFDSSRDRLKVDAEVQATIGDVNVIIDAASGDNIAIKDSDGHELDIQADGTINVNVEVNALDGDSIAVKNSSTGNELAIAADGSIKITEVEAPALVAKVDVASDVLFYKGWAVSGSSTSTATWRIQRIEKVGNVFTKAWADGDRNYNNIWDNRASLTYT